MTRKSTIMVSSNYGVEKQRFTFDMIDSSGGMSGIVFDKECETFFALMLTVFMKYPSLESSKLNLLREEFHTNIK